VTLFLRSTGAAAAPAATADAAVGDLYGGAKASLRPIHDRVMAAIAELGPFEAAPKKTYLSLRRSKQFGLLQPSTATRLDVGLNLKGVPANRRLEASGSFNSMCTHRVRVESTKEIDAELLSWIRKAYEQA